MNSISNQILTAILIAVLVVFGGWGFIQTQNRTKYETERLEKSQIRMGERLSVSLSYPIWNLNIHEVYANISKEAMDENVQAINVYDESGQPYAGIIRENGKLKSQVRKSPFESNPDLIVRQVFHNKKPIAYVVIYPNKEPLQLMIKQLRFDNLLKLTTLIFALASALFFILRTVVIRPLSQLKDWATSVGSDKMLPPTNVYNTTEIDELATSFSEMTNRLVLSHNEIAEKNRQLIESESRIKSISNNFTSGMIYQLIIKPDGTRLFTYLSKSVNTLYGITPEQGIADSSLIYGNVHPEDIEPLRNAEDKAMETLSTFRMDVRMKQTRGVYRWSSFISTPTLLGDGSVRWDGIEFDVTEQKHIQEELRQSQQKFAIAYNLNPDVILIVDQKTLRFMEVNQAISTVFGYSREETIGKTSLELNFFKDYRDREKLTTALKQDGFVHKMEITGRHKSGHNLNLLISVQTTDINNRPSFITTIHDITQRKKMEEELRVSQQKFAIAFNSSPDAIVISEQETGIIIETNDAIKNIFGYSREEVIGKSGLELNMYKDPADRLEDFRVFEKDGYIRNREVTRKHRSGSDLTLILSLELSNINGKPCFISTIHDITERKKMEEELRVSQQKVAIAFNSTPDVIFVTEMETGRIIETNEAVKNIFGYTREEVIGKTTLELGLFKNPEDRQKIYQTMRKNRHIRNLEVIGKHKSGLVLTEILSVEMSEINGTLCLITSVHDITERKKVEEKLRISQQKFAIAFHSTPDAILITEQETGKIIEANDAVKTVFGYNREELIGKTGIELKIYKTPSDRLQAIQTLKESGHIRNMEVIRRHKSGSDVIISMSVESSIIDGIPCFITTNHDITQRKLAEEKLRESEERYKSIISMSNTGAWEYHKDTDFVWCSPEYFSMLGRRQSDYDMSGQRNLQKAWLDLIHPDDRQAAENEFSEYLKNDSPGTYESHFRMKHADGSWKWIWSRGQTLRDVNGTVTNLTVGTHIDITERKLNEMELEKLNLDKDRFMSILGHDLRSPFNGIVGILDLLCTDIRDLNITEIEELLKMADKSAHNASDLLDDVLMWAMAQSGKMTFAPTDFNFNEDCAHVIEILQSVADTKNITINLNSEDNLMVYADKNMLNTILRNLISNALKFTNEGGTVTISSEKKPDNVTISVADTGVGIDPKNVSKIFDKTQLFTSAGTADEKGTGFGLKLCQEFVEKHGGKIWVESELGKGTTFFFSLPNK